GRVRLVTGQPLVERSRIPVQATRHGNGATLAVRGRIEVPRGRLCRGADLEFDRVAAQILAHLVQQRERACRVAELWYGSGSEQCRQVDHAVVVTARDSALQPQLRTL